LGLDGRKMSTTWENVINITDRADEQFGKVMSMRDEMIPNYLMLATDLPLREVEQKIKLFRAKKINPKELKQELAHAIVRRYHGVKAADEAREKFEALFSKKDFSGELPELNIDPTGKEKLFDLIVRSGVVATKSRARILIQQGSIQITRNEKEMPAVKNYLATTHFLQDGDVLKIGKRHFFRIKI